MSGGVNTSHDNTRRSVNIFQKNRLFGGAINSNIKPIVSNIAMSRG